MQKFVLGLAVCLVALISTSCEVEVTSYYSYDITDWSVRTEPAAITGKDAYTIVRKSLERKEVIEVEDIDNEAGSKAKAQNQNDAEAKNKFQAKKAQINIEALRAELKAEGFTTVSGSFTYSCKCTNPDKVIDSQILTF